MSEQPTMQELRARRDQAERNRIASELMAGRCPKCGAKLPTSTNNPSCRNCGEENHL